MTSPHPWRHEPRKQFSKGERAKAYAAADGHCANCRRKIRTGEDWDLDHRIALENGGTNDLENMQVLCEFCHGMKTSDDHSEASKSKRIYTRQHVPARFRRSRAWGR
jgi:5-methylcytosine-specific restriction endonuclease McrA